MSPLVSVVIPVYNRSDIIRRTIISVLNQTYCDLEIIVVDDCSLDSEALANVLNSFDSTIRIQLIRHARNMHGGAARNTGIKAARGEYIAFLDSDDEWLPTKIEKCILAISKSNADFVYSKLKTVGRVNRIFPNRGVNKEEKLSDYLLLNGGAIQTSTIFLKSEVAKRILFDESLVRFQDYDFVVSLESAGCSYDYLDEVLVYMHDDDKGGRISNSYDPRPAIYWIEKVKSKISPEAYSSFYINRVVRYLKLSGDWLSSLKIITNPTKSRVLKLHEYLFWIVFCITPNFVIHFLKHTRSLLERILPR